jgi:hypothetical protein
MKVLFDQGTPVPRRKSLRPHAVDTAFEMGWAELQNGDLIATAEKSGYDVLITTDQNLQYQQNLAGRNLAIVVLTTTSWPRIAKHAEAISQALEGLVSGDFVEIKI